MSSQKWQRLSIDLLGQFQQNDGQTLDPFIQRHLHCVFGAAFPTIRVFEDAAIADAGAIAMAQGTKIGFAPNCYDPDTATGRAVIFHEVGHVLQSLAGLVPQRPDAMLLDNFLEQGAEDAAQWLANAGPVPGWLPKRPNALPWLPSALPLQVLKVNMDSSWVFIVVDPKFAPPTAPQGYTRYWDDILQDYVDVPNFVKQEYEYMLQQALNQRAWNQQQALLQQQAFLRQQALMQQQPQSSSFTPQGSTVLVQPKPLGTSTPVGVQTVSVNTSVVKSSVVAPTIPLKTISKIVFKDNANAFFSCFTQKELMKLRCVSVLFRDEAERIIWNKIVKFSGVSTVIGGQSDPHPSMKAVIQSHLLNVHATGGTALMASDQITSKKALMELLGPCIKIKINIGSKVGQGILTDRRLGAAMVDAPSDHGRPHTKFISGGGSVFVGSPNFTPSALDGGNIETAVSTTSLQAQAFFNRYWELMRRASREDCIQFERLLTAFNARKHKMRLALAPFIQIQPFILEELKDASTIIIRMFLISHRKTNDDIVTGLNALARNGAKIEVVIDEDQFGLYYVQEAVGKLMKGTQNVTVSTQTSYMQGEASIMHDKLILAEIGKGEAIKKRVLLGSSGFTTHVMANENYDLMASFDEDALFDFYLRHHQATLTSKKIATKQIVYK